MTITSKEHYELIAAFENVYKGNYRLDKEPKEIWSKGCIYQHGEMNNLFLAFRQGVAFAKAYYRD